VFQLNVIPVSTVWCSIECYTCIDSMVSIEHHTVGTGITFNWNTILSVQV
jgi:hypothetical protein